MNHIKLAHPGMSKTKYVMGGIGKVYINGNLVEGVLEFKQNILARGDVASVTLTLAVSQFTYGPEERTFQPFDPPYEFRLRD